MKKIKSKIAKITTAVIILIFSLCFSTSALLDSSTAIAIGDLTIDWGVPSGNPIFVVNNAAPGQEESRVVQITNNGTGIRPVGVRAEIDSETQNLSTVLDFTISQGATDIYGGTSSTGPKTLADFFTEAIPPNGIFLSNINPSQSTSYTFKIKFQDSAGNEFQGAQVAFDLIIGISIDLPDECEQIQFSGNPIFGTSIGDSLKGTNNNDLIIGFEGGDTIDGKAGNDCIIGGPGGDSLKGGAGKDLIFGNEGSDSLAGAGEDDLLDGGTGHDSLNGQGGNDVLIAGDGHDSLSGEGGDDQLIGGDGNDSLKGGGGADTLIGGPGFADSANGDGGTDICDAESEKNCELNP